jgi:OmpA-OmpF porin, OOP family
LPAELLLGLRWQTRRGLTITAGGSFGAACGFGAPAMRLWSSVTWQPKSSAEQREINRLLEPDRLDPDHDGLIEGADRCPNQPGRPDNLGCPDADTDHDGFVDREDACPQHARGPGGKKGCPLARVKVDEIAIDAPVEFETGKAILKDASKPVLDAVIRVLHERPYIRLVEIQGHTDVRAGVISDIVSSGRRAKSVRQYLIDHGVDPSRLVAKGYGYRDPIADDKGCRDLSDEELTPRCREAMAKNERVVFALKTLGGPPPTAIAGGDPASASVIPINKHVLPSASSMIFPPCKKEDSSSSPCSVLKKEGVLKKDNVLGKPNKILPSEPILPGGGSNLPKG